MLLRSVQLRRLALKTFITTIVASRPAA